MLFTFSTRSGAKSHHLEGGYQNRERGSKVMLRLHTDVETTAKNENINTLSTKRRFSPQTGWVGYGKIEPRKKARGLKSDHAASS